MVDVCDAVIAGAKSNPRKLLGGPGELPPVALGRFLWFRSSPIVLSSIFFGASEVTRVVSIYLGPRCSVLGRLTLISKTKVQEQEPTGLGLTGLQDERTKPPVISVVSYHSPSATFHVGHSSPYQWAARVERATRHHGKDTLRFVWCALLTLLTLPRKSSNDPFIRTLPTHWILCGCSWILVSFFACLRQFDMLS